MIHKGYNQFFPVPKFLAKPSYGLDISDESIKFIEFVSTSHGIRIGKYGENPIPPGIIESGKIIDTNRIKDILKKMKNEQGISSVRVSLPEEQIYLFKMKIEKEQGVNIREMIELSLESYIPIPTKEVVFDFDLYKEDEKTFEVSVTAAPKIIIESYLSIFRDCEIEVPSFELEAEALARAVIKDKDMETYMIVDFGKDRTGIAIVSRGIVLFTSTIDLGGVMLTKLIEKDFKVSFEEAEKIKLKYGLSRNPQMKEVFATILNGVSILKDEIQKNFIYWHTHKSENGEDRPKIRKILLCGGDSNLIGFSDYLSVSMRQEVELANVWINILSDDYIPEMTFEDSLSYATAIGLALADMDYD